MMLVKGIKNASPSWDVDPSIFPIIQIFIQDSLKAWDITKDTLTADIQETAKFLNPAAPIALTF